MNIFKKGAILTGIVLTAGLTGCTDASKAKISSFGDKHKVEMYSGGELVRTWTATGKVHSAQKSDGYYFNAEECDCLVEVSGDIVITRLN